MPHFGPTTVINTANPDHFGAVETFITALERSGKLLIHTSGSSVVADHADGEYANPVVFMEDTYFEPVPLRKLRAETNRYVRQSGIDPVSNRAQRNPPPRLRLQNRYSLDHRAGSDIRLRRDRSSALGDGP